MKVQGKRAFSEGQADAAAGASTPIRRRALIVVAAIVVVGIAMVVWTVAQAWGHVASAREALGQLQSALPDGQAGLLRDPKQVEAMLGALSTLDADLAALKRLGRPIWRLCPLLGWLPGIGGDVAAAPHLLEAASETSAAGLILAEALGPVASEAGNSQRSLGQILPDLLGQVADSRAKLQAAKEMVQRAGQERDAIDEERLSDTIRAVLGRFDPYLPVLEKGVQALILLPEVLGIDGQRTYLIVAQNSQELRATGGFVSGVGVVRVRSGQIEEIRFQDSYTVDNLKQPHPLPPGPLRRLMLAGMLVLRDANWWPDFPTSAQAIADLYRQDQGVAVDGVIAVDLTTLELLLQATGPIEVPGYDLAVSSENLQEMLMRFWQAPRLSAPGEEGADWWTHRKDLASDLMSALLARVIEQHAPERWAALVWALGTAAGERHLLVYVNDREQQAIVSGLGWDGALRQTSGDYVMVVDSNVGFNKVNPNIEQTIDLVITLDADGRPTTQLTVTYRHRVERPSPACVHEARYGDDYADLMERCYWDYLRIYVPEASDLIEVRGADEPAEVWREAGKMVIGTSFLLETAQARQIQVTYRPALPDVRQGYSLLVQKQPGTEALPLRVTCILPKDHVAAPDTAPGGWVWVDKKAVWQGTLREDRELALPWE